MLGSTARLLRLLTLLQTRAHWTGSELAERLEIEPRTLRRDVDKLRTLGYPVHAASGPAGGYTLGAGAKVPPLQLDDDEAVAVAVGLATSARAGASRLDAAGARALTKLEQVLPQRLRRRIAAVRASIVRVGGDAKACGAGVAIASVGLLADACSERTCVAFGYRDHGGAVTSRVVEPLRVAHTGERWYLVAFDVARDDFRTFRVDRIVGPRPTGARFTPRALPGGDLDAYLADALASAPYRHRARVILHAPASAMRARVSYYDGVLTPRDEGSCVLTTGMHALGALAVWLGVLGVDFEIEEPSELRGYVREVAARLTRCTEPPA